MGGGGRGKGGGNVRAIASMKENLQIFSTLQSFANHR
jgi:hypothetical protein